jgi:hypothetical protein
MLRSLLSGVRNCWRRRAGNLEVAMSQEGFEFAPLRRSKLTPGASSVRCAGRADGLRDGVRRRPARSCLGWALPRLSPGAGLDELGDSERRTPEGFIPLWPAEMLSERTWGRRLYLPADSEFSLHRHRHLSLPVSALPNGRTALLDATRVPRPVLRHRNRPV